MSRDQFLYSLYVPEDEVILAGLPDSIGDHWWLEQFCLFGTQEECT